MVARKKKRKRSLLSLEVPLVAWLVLGCYINAHVDDINEIYIGTLKQSKPTETERCCVSANRNQELRDTYKVFLYVEVSRVVSDPRTLIDLWSLQKPQMLFSNANAQGYPTLKTYYYYLHSSTMR